MRFKLFIEAIESNDLPEPGKLPIPPGTVRLYHYINLKNGMNAEDAVQNVIKNGIDIKLAKGSTYGEPNVVWASTDIPGSNKMFVEFAIPWNDNRWVLGKPQSIQDIEHITKSGANVAFGDSIKPEEIMAVHLPWHKTYRYLKENHMFPRVLQGEFDNLLAKPNSDEAKAIQYIKDNNGKSLH